MKQQQRMAVVKDQINKIRSKGRMDAKNRWLVWELLAKDREKARNNTGWEDTMQKRLNYMKKKDEKAKLEEMHRRKAEKMIRAQRGAGLFDKITKPTMWRGGVKILKKEEEDARLLDRCEAKRKEWAKHWQCDESVQNVEDKLWKMRNRRN